MTDFPEPTTFNGEDRNYDPPILEDDSCPECGAPTPDTCEDWCTCAYCRATHEKAGQDAA